MNRCYGTAEGKHDKSLIETTHLPDDTLVDLKEDHTAQQLLRAMDLGQNGLRFSLSESSDLPEFIRYMAESCC